MFVTRYGFAPRDTSLTALALVSLLCKELWLFIFAHFLFQILYVRFAFLSLLTRPLLPFSPYHDANGSVEDLVRGYLLKSYLAYLPSSVFVCFFHLAFCLSLMRQLASSSTNSWCVWVLISLQLFSQL